MSFDNLEKKELRQEKNTVAIGVDAESRKAKNTSITKTCKMVTYTHGKSVTGARSL